MRAASILTPVVLSILGAISIHQLAQAQSGSQAFPNRPIRWIVPSSPSGGSDVIARAVAPKLTELWGQPVVVDNRSGAGGIIGSDLVAKSPPDGYTIVIVAPGYALNVFFYKKLPYDTLNDFERVTVVATAPNVLVAHPSLPVKSVKELIALAQARPGQLNYASSGRGTGGHLCAELFKSMAKVDMVAVYFKGAGDSTLGVVSGQTELLFTATGAVVPLIQSGKLRALGVTGRQRAAALANVATIEEQGLPGYEYIGWYGVLAAGRTPREIINRLYADIAKSAKSSEVAERLARFGYEPLGNTPDEFTALVRSEMLKWGKLLQAIGVKPE